MLVLHSDQMMTCPLDEAHRIRKERMQFHLVRCAKNHTMEGKLKCPWNPLHILDKFAWKNHWMVECEDMPAAVAFKYTDEPSTEIRTVPINTTKPDFEDGENWDAEPYTGTYDPVKNAEKKPILRVNIGLSKAQKKQWRQAERKRIQDLQANEPLKLNKPQEKAKPEKSTVVPGPLRKPYSKGLVLSANDSMVDELNSSKPSINSEKKTTTEEHINLRKPHAPSPAMSMKFPSAKPKTFNDSTITSQDIGSVASGGDNLANQEPNSDAVSIISGISCSSSRRADLELVRQECTRNLTKKCTTDENEDDISHRLANLTTMEKSIRNEKAEILEHMTKIVPKLVSPKSLKGSSILEDGSDRGKITPDSNVQPLPAFGAGKSENFIHPMAKCAASFPALKKPHPASAGRGMALDLKAFKERSQDKNNAGGNTSRSYAASVSSVGELSSVYGYEEIYP